MRPFKLIAIALLLLPLLPACGATPQTHAGYTTVTTGTITPNEQIAPPSGPVVLSLTGKIGLTNAEGRLDFDLETLERLGLVEFTVNDPHIKRLVTYQGVLLQRVIELARVSPDATTMRAVALNDYATDVPLAPVKEWPVMLATKRDGQRMPVADKGPIEIVFPYDSFPIDPETHDQMWVWQLRTLEVR